MTFDIKFDYRFDESNFFTPERKAVLEKAGEIWSFYIQDEFEAIEAGEELKFAIDKTAREVTLDEPIDDLIIFVSSVKLDSDRATLGEGAFFASYTIGSDREERIIGDDFQPWLGTIEFNTTVEDRFFFDPTPATDDDIPLNKQDFLSLSLHEIGHVLGIGIAPRFSRLVKNGEFTGTASVGLNESQPIPLGKFENHVKEGFSLDVNSDPLLDESFTFGERTLPTDLDLAILADIGYEITAYDRTPVYRFFQSEKGFHFYTSSDIERQNVVERSAEGELQYDYENVAYNVLASNKDRLTGAEIEAASPVYRFFNTDTGAHLYTMDENEKDFVIDNLDNYIFENEAYYAFETPTEDIETVPLYRMLNTQTGSHLYTTDSNEFNFIKDNFSNFQVEGNGGVTFYVLE